MKKKRIEECLSERLWMVDEIIIVDDEVPMDRTIAQKFTNKIFHRRWN